MNVLKVTTPLGGYDATNHGRGAEAGKVPTPNVQVPVTPDKVVRTDGRTDANAQEQKVGLRYESTFHSFLEQISTAPHATDLLTSAFLQELKTMAQSGMSQGIAQQLHQFIAMISVEEGDLAGVFKTQSQASAKLGGVFFTLLRQAMDQSPSAEMKNSVLDFLKKYVDMAETPRMEQNMQRILKRLEGYLLPGARQELAQMTAQEGNLQDGIKKDILPFLNRQISAGHDRGTLRDLTAQLAKDLARCENGQAQRVQDAFNQLMRYQAMRANFQDFDPSLLMRLLGNTEYQRAIRSNRWMDAFVDVIQGGLSGEAGSESKAVFRNLVQSTLLNESVYMPVLHTLLPMHVNDKLSLAEMWIDPDAQGEGSRGGEGRAVQGLVKFDIQDKGFFDLFFVYQDGKMRLQVHCPQSMEEDLSKITTDLHAIIARNHMSAEELFVEVGEESIPITTAFPQVFSGKGGVNVKI